MRFGLYQLSRKGGRAKNEDRMGYCYTRASGLFAVADGMGGHPEGEVAAQMALQTLAASFQRDARPALAQPLAHLEDALLAAHHQLLRYATERALIDTPRTTAVACVIQNQTVHWAYCGDSRLYLVRHGRLLVHTRDHSYSQLQESLSRLAVPGGQPVNRSVLFTCLGSPGRPIIDTGGPITLQTGDRLLLCSDGLWATLKDEEIVDGLAQRPLSESVPALVDEALRRGGARADNTTALAIEWEAQQPTDVAQRDDLDDESFASTIQASLETDSVALDEADIERSIREINEAIARSHTRRGRT